MLVASAGLLFTVHIAVVFLIGPSWRGALFSNLIQLTLGILTVAATRMAALRCGKLGRYFWTLASISYGIWSVAQALGTYAESFSPGFAEKLDNFLFFCWFIPIGLTLLLNEDSDFTLSDWLRAIDVSQSVLFWLAAYMYFRMPLGPKDVAPPPGSLYFVCWGVITAAFFLRSWLSSSKIARALLLRGGVILLLSGGIDILYQYGPGKDLPSGAWFDVLWSSLVCISLVAAARWNENEAGKVVLPPMRGANQQVLTQLFSLLYPLMTLCMAIPIMRGHMASASAIVLLSLAGTGARLLITQHRLVAAQEALRCDLSRRQKAEEAMRESEARFRGAFDFAAIGMAIVAPDGRYLRVNQSLCDIVGYSDRELLAMDFQSITHPDDLESDLSLGRKLLDGSIPYIHLEKRFLHKNGKIIWILVSVSLVRDAQSQPLYSVAQIQDITKRKEAEEAHRQSEERFAKAFGSNPDGIAISTRSEGRILEVNDAYVRMMGYERVELLGKTVGELGIWDPQEREKVLAKLAQERSIRDYETQFHIKGGKTIQVQISLEEIQVQQEPCLLTTIRDITEGRLMERRLRAAQKMEAVGRLAGGVAHDFNNLLMIISGSAQMLEKAQHNGESNAHYLAQIQAATDKAASLTGQLLAFSRQQVLNPTVLNLNAVVRDMWKLLPPLLGEDIETVLHLASDLANVSADRGQIEQVIMNLAVNARDAMPKGGKLLLETANVELNDAAASRHGAGIPAGPYVMLAVTDTGIGMDAETQAKIFEPFFTTKELGKGTGLGLATVYGIVKQSAGYVWVYSEVGKGSSFKVYLPRELQDAPAAALPEPGVSLPCRGEETVLLVEDEADLRELAVGFLASQGYTVLEAANRLDALRVCREHVGPIHVMVTDVVLPGGGGPDLARAALEMRPNLRMIYMSGYTDQILSAELIGQNACFLQKPFSLSVLAREIRCSLGSGSLTPR
jgi:PAS domain S-box-containing protein